MIGCVKILSNLSEKIILSDKYGVTMTPPNSPSNANIRRFSKQNESIFDDSDARLEVLLLKSLMHTFWPLFRAF